MNSITVAGVVGKDAELAILQDGNHVANFSIADSQGKDKTIWWNATLWGRKAESLSSYITKGTKVTVAGSLSEESWTDKKTGETRKAFRLRVNDVLLQSSRQEQKPAVHEPQPAPATDEDVPF